MIEDDQIFTKEQLLKVTELAELFPSEKVAHDFGIKAGRFVKLRREQPELNEAYNKGAKIRALRRIADKAAGRTGAKTKLIKMPEYIVPIELNSENDAWAGFKKKFQENKERELKKELNEIRNILL